MATKARKTVAKRPRMPWELPPGFPADWSAEIVAMQCFAQGTADEYQQRTAWRFVVEVLSNADGMTFMPDSERASSFAEGCRFVGRQMRMIARLKPKGVDPRGEPPPMPGQKSET